jgi:NADPH:quinone reductase
MRAALYRRPGPASEVLAVEEVPTPEPGPGEVRVRVNVSGVNPTDWKARSGAVPPPAAGRGGPDFQIPHHDGAGVVDAVGAGVDPARVGQRVWTYLAAHGRPWGTAAEHTVVPADRAVPLPDNATFELGANLGVPAMTAHRCLFADGPVDGRTVLVAGGAGAVGHFAIELAVASGATVIATVSGPEKAKLAAAAGAHHVVNYREEGAAGRIKRAAPGGVDRIVEVNLADNLTLDLEVAGRYASIVTYAATAKQPALAVRDLMTRNLVLRFMLLYTVPPEALTAAVQDITSAIAAGALTPLPPTSYPLDRVAAAHDAVEGGAVGKVLVTVGGPDLG